MGGTNIKITAPGPAKTNRPQGLKQALAFTLPAAFVTVGSIVIFSMLTGFTAGALNSFLTVLFVSLILSLVGTAGLQVRISQAMEANRLADKSLSAASGTVWQAIMFALVYAAGAAFIVFLIRGLLALSMTDYIALVVLLAVFSMLWVILAALWGTKKLFLTAALYTAGYAFVLIVTLGVNRFKPDYTLYGYTGSTLLLLLVALLALTVVLDKSKLGDKETMTPIRIKGPGVVTIAFAVSYVAAIFLDKIIVWVYQGAQSGGGLLISGPYTIGAFLGLIPLLGMAGTIYFNNAATSLLDKRYDGTLGEIRTRNRAYLDKYHRSLGLTFGIWAVLAFAALLTAYFLHQNNLVLTVTFTVAIGSLFILYIFHNTQLLVTLGHEWVSLAAMLLVILGELTGALFVSRSVEYVAVGFTAGGLAGCLASQISLEYFGKHFELQLYQYALRLAGFNWK